MSDDLFASTPDERLFARPFLVLDGMKASALMRREITRTQLQVFVALFSHCREDWVAWPRVARLCEMTGAGDRTVRRALRELVGLGWLQVVGETPGGVKRYQLTAPKPQGGACQQWQGGAASSGRQKGKGIEGRSSLEEAPLTGAGPELPSTQEWETLADDLASTWRVTPEARGRFFSLCRSEGWTAEQVQTRLSYYAEFSEKLDWSLAPLARVLDVKAGLLTDRYLGGLEAEAKKPKRGRA